MNCRNSLCWGPLAIIALCAPLYAHAGVLSASVTLSGPSEGWVQTDLGYVAEPDFTVDADTQQELLAGSAQPEYEYEWSYTPANLVRGGGIADDWMDISYAWADGAAYHTVSVRLTVRVRYNDGTVSSKVATDSMLVKVRRHEISVVAAKSSICAGARANAVHQTSVTATVTDGWGAAPPETVTVTFSVLPHAHVVTQASLSTTNPLATNALGQASVVLTSSDQPGTVTVRAAVSEDIAGTVNVSIQKPTGAPDPEPPITVAAQTSQLLQELLRFAGTVPVPDHSLLWTISEVEDDQGQPVPDPSSEDYGYVQVEANPTDATGRGAGRYCAGTLPGSIRVLATDQNCYNADSTPLTFEFAINVEGPELTSVVSSNGEICAGHQPNGVHQASITALVEFSAGVPAPNVPVAFEITAQEFVVQPATLSSGQATTGPDGCATVILTSSDQACTITVQATVQSDDPQTTTVSCALPYSEPSPTETSVIPQTGVSSKLLQETLRFGSGTCVPGHALGWEVVELWDVDGNQVSLPANAQDWGSVQATANPTTTGGVATGTYTAGANRCTVLVAAKDTTCYDANGDAPYLDVFEIVVAGLDRLEVSGAYQVGETNKYAIGLNSGYVTITAVLTPAVYGDVDIPLIWTGGMPVEGNPLQRQVAMSPSGTTSVTAQFGMQSETVYILVCRVVALSVYCANNSAYMMDQSQAITKADPLDTGGAIVRAYVEPWVQNEPMPPQLLYWEPDYGGAVDGDDRARRVSRNVPYEYHFKGSCGTSSAELTLWVIGIDFNLASDEIYVNTDDDDVSSAQDKNESPVINENDMTTIRPEVLPPNAPIFLEGQVTITGSPGIALWEDDQKTTAPYGVWLNSCPDCLWVEGTQVSSTTGDRTITLQCSVAANYWDWIYGTGETGYWYPGGGMQWDFEEQVHLTVLPREGNSEAYLRLFTNEGLTNEITNNTPIGGTVYPTLYVKIGPGERVKGGTSTVTVRVHDLYDNYDPGTTVDFDTQVDMVSATGWQAEQPDHSWIDATCGPAAIDNKEGADPILYRRKLTWDTTSLPTRGNGLHTIGTTAKVRFEEWVVNEGWTNDYECGPWNLKPDVENLYLGDRTGNGVYITGVKVTEGTIDYFKWDPDAGPTPVDAEDRVQDSGCRPG